MTNRILINRRRGSDRRRGDEQRQNPRLDLLARRRRVVRERRQSDRPLAIDFYAAQQRIATADPSFSTSEKH